MSALPPAVTVKAGHVLPLWAGHPWVFKQAVEKMDDGVGPGDEVLVIDPHGRILGRGLYSATSAIAVRMFTRAGERMVDGALLHERLERAVGLRRAAGLPDATPGRETNGYRLVHGEGDGLPGLIVDAFDDVLVVQLGTVGLRSRWELVVQSLCALCSPRAIVDRTPPAVAQAEGLATEAGGARALHGDLPTSLQFLERGLRHELPLELGQKTGYYFDQRPLRARLESLAPGSRVLDACCYTGSIGLNAARAGAAHVWGVDKSAPAIEAGRRGIALNGLDARMELEVLDASSAFKRAAEQGGMDVVVCDPPKLGAGKRNREKAFGGYRKLAAGATAATAAGGVLAFCSCAAAVGLEALQRCLALGARDAGRRAVVFERLFQGADHPVPAAFPEGLYLKILLARVETG
jgi:23S rRNA (cytosine1962-C5)-methyltransferase